MRYTHFFFDMDKTVTPARQNVLPHMHELLSSLPAGVVIISGGAVPRIREQMQGAGTHYLGVNGGHAITVEGEELWQDPPLADHHKEAIHEHISKLRTMFGIEPNPEWIPIEDRGAQISFSGVGNTAPAEVKEVFDPDRSKRLSWLDSVPFESDELVVKIGGSTTLDYFHKNGHKGANVARFIERHDWDKNACVYFGDGLYPGGNDETVIGVIDAVAVENEEDTYQRLQAMLR